MGRRTRRRTAPNWHRRAWGRPGEAAWRTRGFSRPPLAHRLHSFMTLTGIEPTVGPRKSKAGLLCNRCTPFHYYIALPCMRASNPICGKPLLLLWNRQAVKCGGLGVGSSITSELGRFNVASGGCAWPAYPTSAGRDRMVDENYSEEEFREMKLALLKDIDQRLSQRC